MPLTPIERKATFVAACTLKGLTLTNAAKQECGVSWQHLDLVLLGGREGSVELKQKVAAFVGVSAHLFWKESVAVAS